MKIHPVIALVVLAPWIARADHYDVYLLAGQSNAGGHGYVSREFSQFSPQGDDGLVELGQSAYLQPQPDTLFIHWRGGNPGPARPVLWDARSDGWIPLRAGYPLYGYNSGNPEQLGAEIPNHPFGAEVTFAERIREGRPGRKVAIIKESSQLVPGGSCQLAWTSQPGFEYGLEWSSDLAVWNLFRIVPAAPGTATSDTFADPGDGKRLFLRVR